MDILIIRHGIATPREEARDGDDRGRALTDRGRRRMRRVARGLSRWVPRLDAIASSPYVRTLETARLVADRYPGLELVELPALEPDGTPEEVAKWLSRHRDEAVVALVGHSPNLELLASWLLSGVTTSFLALGKGSALLLHVRGARGPSSAELIWHLPANLLRKVR